MGLHEKLGSFGAVSHLPDLGSFGENVQVDLPAIGFVRRWEACRISFETIRVRIGHLANHGKVLTNLGVYLHRRLKEVYAIRG